MSKPTIPKGTRDFLPHQFAKREYIFNTIRDIFVRYGYSGIETPAMETLTTLTGKYGEEGDKLLFKILNNGDYLSKADTRALETRDTHKLTPSISKRGLRYDLTVPLARFVVMHLNDLQLPFKRYAIQPVWRADRPQKGRYQEFYQCDVDVVGSDSLMYEAELIQIFDQVYDQLNIPVEMLLNNRKILAGIAETYGIKDQNFGAFAIIIDKLDKISEEDVMLQLTSLDLSIDSSRQLLKTLQITNLEELYPVLAQSALGKKGIGELQEVLDYLRLTPLHNKLSINLTLARGLSYYTGCIIEVKATSVQIGSIGGGGRYDDLTGVFGMKGVSGVGISLGAARIYDVMEELNLFQDLQIGQTDVIILSLDEASHKYAFQLGGQLRASQVSVDIYPDLAKFKKQMKYAGRGSYRYALIIGEEERASGLMTMKNLTDGSQLKVDLQEVAAFLNQQVDESK